MVPLKCKNCGAPINPELTKCEYCDVSFYLNNNEDKLSSAKRKEETREDINKAVRNVKDGIREKILVKKSMDKLVFSQKVVNELKYIDYK